MENSSQSSRKDVVLLDPKGGDPLLQPEARDALIEELLPLAYVVTPNHHEAQRRIEDLDKMVCVRVEPAQVLADGVPHPGAPQDLG